MIHTIVRHGLRNCNCAHVFRHIKRSFFSNEGSCKLTLYSVSILFLVYVACVRNSFFYAEDLVACSLTKAVHPESLLQSHFLFWKWSKESSNVLLFLIMEPIILTTEGEPGLYFS